MPNEYDPETRITVSSPAPEEVTEDDRKNRVIRGGITIDCPIDCVWIETEDGDES